jgi:hypothetical protein
MEGVPTAAWRRVPLQQLREHLHPDYADTWAQIRHRLDPSPQGRVEGTVVQLPAVMRRIGPRTAEQRRRWRGWVEGTAPLPDNRRALASDLSTARLFDYLTGHPGRSEGVHVGPDTGRRIILWGHARAFEVPLPPERERRLRRRMAQVGRVSRAFVQRLAGLELDFLGCREDPESRPGVASGPPCLLSDRQRSELRDRQATVLSHVGARMAEHGERKVLVFP